MTRAVAVCKTDGHTVERIFRAPGSANPGEMRSYKIILRPDQGTVVCYEAIILWQEIVDATTATQRGYHKHGV